MLSSEITRKLRVNNKKIFEKAFPKTINLYEQAYLIKKNIVPFQKKFKQTPNQIGISFDLKGELSGRVISILELPHFSDAQQKLSIQTLHMESINILIGKFLTELESKINIMATLTFPKICDHESLANSKINSLTFEYQFDALYYLIKNDHQYNCHIYLLANSAHILEV